MTFEYSFYNEFSEKLNTNLKIRLNKFLTLEPIEKIENIFNNLRKNLKIGICGEHGGDPASVEFCHQNGLDYVSCSPFRVPIARFAAAQAAIKYRD